MLNQLILKNENMKQNQFEFKPFDKVLVRDTNDEIWYPAFFRHYNENDKDYPYTCDELEWKQCIPYNENTSHLVNTSKPYKSEQPQEKKIHVWTTGTFNEWMTEDEFKNFINTAVIHNKDITDFHVLYIR